MTHLLTLNNITMRKFKFLLIAVAIFGLSTFYACNGSGNDETNKDSTEVATDEPTLKKLRIQQQQ